MIDADKPEFAKVLIGFAELKGKQLSKPAVELYWCAMQHWEIQDFQAAAVQLLRSCAFMPTPFDFEQLRQAAAGALPDEAWMQLLENHGECSDPIGAKALRSLGGWQVVGFVDMTRLPWLKERFREAYENFHESQTAVAALGHESGSQVGAFQPAQLLTRIDADQVVSRR